VTRRGAMAAAVASLAARAGLPACGGSDARADPPSCEDRDGLVCNPPGFPFVASAVAVSDYCFVDPSMPETWLATTIPPAGSTTARLTTPATGKLCMAGTAAAPDGWAVLALRFFDTLNPDGTFVTNFHPVAAGITAIRMTIDSPPSAGITLSRIGGFHVELPSNPGVPLIVTQPGPITLPLTGFVSGDSPPVTLAPDDVQTVGFNVGPGVYDFCVRDFKFLDAVGNEVTHR
jgi:hypothetical protein